MAAERDADANGAHGAPHPEMGERHLMVNGWRQFRANLEQPLLCFDPLRTFGFDP